MSRILALDSSALVAVILGEDESATFVGILEDAERVLFSPVSLVESGIVLEKRLGPQGSRELDEFLRRYVVEICPVDAEQGRAALLAFWRFGRGLHPAGLNFGDCFSYALAKVKGIPLLFKGGDFARTDVPIFPE